MFGGNRELLAQSLYWSGVAALLAALPARDVLLVLNYHRIGNSADDLFDPGVFSATGEKFDRQIAFLKSKFSMVTLEEALAFVEGRDKAMAPRCRVLITFDDGYLDNYSTAFPILRSHQVQGVFFLVTSMVGSSHVPWWDRVAFTLNTARRRRFRLRYPASLEVDLDRNAMARREVLGLYKRPDNHDPDRFLSELKQAADPGELPSTSRRFLDWDEAREMVNGGMAIGSHTHSHPVLSQLEPARQAEELAQSRAILKRQLGIETTALAYPVGDAKSFRDRTGHLARDLGYRAAFSFYGGTNLPENVRPFDVKRVGIGGQSRPRFRVQTAICKRTGAHWP